MIIVLNFICGPCGEADHFHCVSLNNNTKELVIKSQCDCQHREKAKTNDRSA